MEKKIVVVGLGYVGLPLAVAFSKHYHVIGFDVNVERVIELSSGYDRTKEIPSQELNEAQSIEFTSSTREIESGNIYIIAVPTPIDDHKKPNLKPLIEATKIVGSVLKKNDTVIYESTVYPGATEEDCVPVLENSSGLKFNKDFFCGYSPERINPGDTERRISDIVKVTSGSTPEISLKIDKLYNQIISAGTYRAQSIKVAEAAKIIENTQRDVNIALINELSQIFNKLGIDTHDVLEAAKSKWNFLPFAPGLVGGHCIGVDPYYLTYKSEAVGHHPQVILSGRQINDGMASYAATLMIKRMIAAQKLIHGSRILILGIAFKENCPDIRNTKVVDMKRELEDFGINVDVHDPEINPDEVVSEYGFSVCERPEIESYDGVILAVPHNCFISGGPAEVKKYGKRDALFFDLKSVFPSKDSHLRL